MKLTVFPTVSEVLELHSKLLIKFGGKSGVRDLGLLESAIYRPQSGYYASLSVQAAALMQSLAQNHAFLDGNKRIAFAVTAIFLRMNGYVLKVSTDDGESFLIEDVIKEKADLKTITHWLEKRMKKAN